MICHVADPTLKTEGSHMEEESREKRGGILGLREQGDGGWRWGHRIAEAPRPVQQPHTKCLIDPIKHKSKDLESHSAECRASNPGEWSPSECRALSEGAISGL